MEFKTNECFICKKQFSSPQALGGHMNYHYGLHPLPPHLQNPQTPQPVEQPDPTSPSFHPQRPKRSLMPVNYKEVSDEEEEEEAEVMSGPSRVQTHETNHSDKMRRLNDMAVGNSLVFTCEVCGRRFETKRGLGKHKRSHVPRVVTTVNNGCIDVPPSIENPRIMMDLNEPTPVKEGDDEVPNPKE